MELDNYIKRKKILKNIMDELDKITDGLKLNNINQKIKTSIRGLDEENFNLVTVGEFSRGKSTFINAILGKKILPSSKNPTTNIINKIIYGKEPEYILVYKDKSTEKISEDKFKNIKVQSERSIIKKTAAMITDKLSGRDASLDVENISYAEIAYPIDFCKNNVVVIDTPGTNDLNIGRMEITYNYLKEAEAAILVLSATQALTASEKEFLRERILENNIKDIFIVVNYKDSIEVGEEEVVKKHIIDNLAEIADFSNKTFLVSSKQALLYRRNLGGEKLTRKQQIELPPDLETTGFPNFERALYKFLEEEKGTAKLHKYIDASMNYLEDLTANLKDKLSAVDDSSEVLTNRLMVQKPKFERIKKQTKHIIDYMNNELDYQKAEIETMTIDMKKEINSAVEKAAATYSFGMTGSELNHNLEVAIDPIQKKYINKINSFQNETIDKISEESVIKLRRIWSDMDCDIKKFPVKKIIFSDISVDNIETNEAEKNARSSGVGLGLLATAVFGPLGGAIVGVGTYLYNGGNFVGIESPENQIKKRIKSIYTDELGTLTDNVIGQYQRGTKCLCNSLQREIDSKLEEMNQQLIMLIEEKQKKDYNTELEKKKISQQLKEVNALREKLSEVL